MYDIWCSKQIMIIMLQLLATTCCSCWPQPSVLEFTAGELSVTNKFETAIACRLPMCAHPCLYSHLNTVLTRPARPSPSVRPTPYAQHVPQLYMDHTAPLLDASRDVVTMVLHTLSYKDRFTCALVCKALAKAAAAATRSIILKHRVKGLTCLQHWLKNNGQHVEVLQLQCGLATLTALPCTQLQDLLLHGGVQVEGLIQVDSGVWGDIAAATNLTSLSLEKINTACQHADVVSALTALQDLQQLTWSETTCGREARLSDSLLLQRLTQLTGLKVCRVSTEGLEHLSSLAQLQHLSITAARDWVAAGCPGLHKLKALRSFQLLRSGNDIPASISELTALQQLHVSTASLTALNRLHVLTGLTQLRVGTLAGLPAQSAPLQLPGLQRLELQKSHIPLPTASLLTKCTQLQVLKVSDTKLRGPGSLVASTMLQYLELNSCRVSAAADAVDPASWQQVFPGLSQLPHLTSLQLSGLEPVLEQSDTEYVAACCSSLQVLHLDTFLTAPPVALTRLSGLTSLHLGSISDKLCSILAQLTGLRRLTARSSLLVSTAGLKQLAALEQLTTLAFPSSSPELVGACAALRGFASFNPSTVSCEVQGLMSDRLPGYAHAVVNKAPAGSPPDVSARLLRPWYMWC